ncbi:Nif3-like dinuclear metal center hexameric protein [Desulfurella sp.]|uniref:Nif3-like dinuclear metal center hexameric protein n=1 Tax=Desulfurella sp. TaxID=1962857 RepID=UPI0025BD115A|nr:Nif3-like dinuclear metal center hexameric protein [Desulfurella sp.]
MFIFEAIEALESFFPLSFQESWDNSGFQVLFKHKILSGILLSLDVRQKTVEEAKQNNCNLIISHHPLFLQALKNFDYKFYPENVLYVATKNEISIYAAHTNLDISPSGLNNYLCKKLQLKNFYILDNLKPVFIGELEKESNFDEFIYYVKKTLGIPILKYVLSNNKHIKKVAICSGSCADYIYKLKSYDIDVFITGDVKHHSAVFAQENGINMIDATHFYTEIWFADILFEYLKNFNVKILRSTNDRIPWDYI